MINIAKAPEGAILSDKWKVSIGDEFLSVYIALCPEGKPYCTLPEDVHKEFDGCTYGATTTKKTYFASFTSDETTKLEVCYDGEVKDFTVKPRSLNKKVIKNENKLILDINPGEKITIEPDDDIYGSINIFCNCFYEKDDTFENVIDFEKGYYSADNCDYITINEHGNPVIDNIKDNTLIHIADGAVVNAALILDNVKNVKICGYGVISLLERCHGAENDFESDTFYGGRRYWALPNIFIRSGCENIIVEGIALNCEFRGIVIRNSKNITIDNVKIFTSCVNSDAINTVNIQNVCVKNCFIKCGDDCFAVFTSHDDIDPLADNDYKYKTNISKNIEIYNCIMSTNCRIFMIGGHGTGEEFPANEISNIKIHDIEIINIANRLFIFEEKHSRYWSGIFRILSQSRQYIKEVCFENINVDWTKGYMGKAFHIEIRNDETASYTESRGYKIDNIVYKNISFINCPEKMQKSLVVDGLKDKTDDGGISNIVFDNVTYNKVLQCDENIEMDI